MFTHQPFVATVLFGVSVPDELFPELVGGAIATGLGLYVTASGIKDVTDWWRLETTESVSTAESVTTNGLVQIRGTVRPSQSSDTLRSPIRDIECVAYEYNLSQQIHGTGDPSIDSGIECSPFVISDGNGKISVNPTEESLSLAHKTNTVTGGKELLEQIHMERLELDSSVLRDESGLIEDRIELVEGTLTIGEKATVVGKTTTVPAQVGGDVDAAMTPEEGHLIVTNDDPGTASLRTAARGFFLLVLGVGLAIMGSGALVANTANLFV